MLNINLLPPAYKKEIAASKDNIKKVRALLAIICILLFAIIMSYFQLTVMHAKTEEKDSMLQQAEKQIKENEPIEKEFNNLSSRITQLKKIASDQVFPTKLYYEIGAVKPIGLVIKNLSIESDPKKEQIISGEANNLDLIAQFRDELEESELISTANINIRY